MNNRHPIIEDIAALITSCILFSFGIYLFSSAGLLTGGLAGVSLLLNHVTPFTVGTILFVLNVPFFYLAYTQMGARFTINTLLTILCISLCVDNLEHVLRIDELNPIYASLAGGIFCGTSLLVLARHNSSSGGLALFVLYLQEKFGLRAGYVLLGIDTAVVLCGSFIMPLHLVFISVIGTSVVSLIMALNHKPGRYQAHQIAAIEEAKANS